MKATKTELISFTIFIVYLHQNYEYIIYQVSGLLWNLFSTSPKLPGKSLARAYISK